MDYKSAGVDIDAGKEAVKRIAEGARLTYTPNVLTGLDSFGSVSYTHLTLPTKA